MNKKELIADERLIIVTSGEIPEVAFHGSIYYLTEDEEGPGIDLAPGDIRALEEMVIERYKIIILRDLLPENRDKSLYRGVARSAVSWQRLSKFSAKRNWDLGSIKNEIAAALIDFLKQESEDALLRKRKPCINCSSEILEDFARELGINLSDFPACWPDLCP